MIILLAAIIVFCLYAQAFLTDTSDSFRQSLEGIKDSINNSDWAEAEYGIEQTEKGWREAKSRWAALTDHSEIDNIEITLERLKEYIKSQDTSSSLAELSALIKYITHVPRKEILNLENIF